MAPIIPIIIKAAAAIGGGWVASDVYNEHKKAQQALPGEQKPTMIDTIMRPSNLIVIAAIVAIYYFLTKKNQ